MLLEVLMVVVAVLTAADVVMRAVDKVKPSAKLEKVETYVEDAEGLAQKAVDAMTPAAPATK